MKRTELRAMAKRAYSYRYGTRVHGDSVFRAAWLIGWQSGFRSRRRPQEGKTPEGGK